MCVVGTTSTGLPQCSNPCQPGFYLEAETSSCQSCQPSCLICTSSVDCYQCMTGYYLDNNLCILCSNAMEHCQECSSSSVCSVCDNTFSVELNSTTHQCICRDGFYPDSYPFICQSCQPNCLSCDNSVTCVICNSSVSQLNAASDQCQCLPGTYPNLTGYCTPCNSSLVGCLECSS